MTIPATAFFAEKARKLSSSWSIEKGVIREPTVGQRSDGREESVRRAVERRCETNGRRNFVKMRIGIEQIEW